MTINLALDHIPRRMVELGQGSNYMIRFRHLVLQPMQKLELEASNELFILIEPPTDMSVSSELGLFDLSNTQVNEQVYEHQGQIQISNDANTLQNLRAIQVIIKN